jgi:hypothetical protein
MSTLKKSVRRERQAARWAEGLMQSVRAVLAVRPEADPDNVRHTLILLEHPPLERLRKSLTRGRALAQVAAGGKPKKSLPAQKRERSR